MGGAPCGDRGGAAYPVTPHSHASGGPPTRQQPHIDISAGLVGCWLRSHSALNPPLLHPPPHPLPLTYQAPAGGTGPRRRGPHVVVQALHGGEAGHLVPAPQDGTHAGQGPHGQLGQDSGSTHNVRHAVRVAHAAHNTHAQEQQAVHCPRDRGGGGGKEWRWTWRHGGDVEGVWGGGGNTIACMENVVEGGDDME